MAGSGSKSSGTYKGIALGLCRKKYKKITDSQATKRGKEDSHADAEIFVNGGLAFVQMTKRRDRCGPRDIAGTDEQKISHDGRSQQHPNNYVGFHSGLV